MNGLDRLEVVEDLEVEEQVPEQRRPHQREI
jgi:hypothetical protein